MASALGHRYASALVDIVLKPGSTLEPEDAVAQLRAAAQMVAQSAELRTALLTPAIPTSRKRAVMAKLLDEIGASTYVRNFIYVVINHRRIGMLNEMSEAFELALDERMGFARAEVVSASAVDEKRKTDALAFSSRSGPAGWSDGAHRIYALRRIVARPTAAAAARIDGRSCGIGDRDS
jgi:F-type H+-transporting ATPase subunit delta